MIDVEAAIRNAQSFEGLQEVIESRKIGRILKRKYLDGAVELVMTGELPLDRIPERLGLRERVGVLLKTDWEAIGRRFGYAKADGHYAGIIDKILPTEGFKLHISAYPESASGILRTVLDIAQRRDICGKYERSSEWLTKTNSDEVQRGKFITLYPRTDEEAVELATEIDARLAERGYTPSHGPTVPYDRAFGGKSGLVYYRYGLFSTRADGIMDPNVQLARDDRRIAVPAWIKDPFKDRE